MPSFPVFSLLSYLYLKHGNCSKLEELKLFILKEKIIYHNLNKLRLKNSFFHGNCWIPKESESLIFESLKNLEESNRNIAGGSLEIIPDNEREKGLEPPTYFKLNIITCHF